MDDSGFYIGDSNDSDSCIRWGKDGTISVTGSISGMIQEGVLPGYGPIIITIWHELPEIGARTFLPPQVPPKTTFCINGIPVLKEEAELVSNALKSQAGELTAADFYPDRVEEILRRVKFESSPASP